MSRVIILIFIVFFSNNSISQCLNNTQTIIPIDVIGCDNRDWILVFESNFENGLDTMIWLPRYPWGNTNNGLEYNRFENLEVYNNVLNIVAKEESYADRNYTSGVIWSRKEFSFGKFEIRCKIPSGRGLWPAFWLWTQGDNNTNDEIDVFEFWKNDFSKMEMTVHFEGDMCSSIYSSSDFSQEFHTYTLIWDEYKIEWYVDNQLVRFYPRFYSVLGQKLDCSSVLPFLQCVRNNQFPTKSRPIIANLAIQANPNYLPDHSTQLPKKFEIDYIRYYQKKDCPEDLTIDNEYLNELNNKFFNTVVAGKILLDFNYTSSSKQNLNVVAYSEIISSSDIILGENLDLVLEVNSNACNNEEDPIVSGKDEVFLNFKYDLFNSPSEVSIIKYDKDKQIINIDNLNNENNHNLLMIVSNLLGQVIVKENFSSNEFYKYNMNSSNLRGTYLISLIDITDNKIIDNLKIFL